MTLSPDTQAALLLCGHFGARKGPRPLGLREYNLLATWLRREGARPGDLLTGLAVPPDVAAPDRVRALLERGGGLAFTVEAWERRGIWVVGRADAAYPQRLRALGSRAPVLLYGAGDVALFGREAVGAVGSRDAAPESLHLARQLGGACASDGLAVVSGGAKGVDREAMLGALDAGGVAVAFLAEGVAKPSVSKLWRRAVAGGRLALASAVVPEARWARAEALGRNRLIHAQSEWSVVVESGTSGGTWEGAREALAGDLAPVLVHVGPGAGPGNRALVADGAAAVSLPSAIAESSVREALREAVRAGAGQGSLFGSL